MCQKGKQYYTALRVYCDQLCLLNTSSIILDYRPKFLHYDWMKAEEAGEE